MEAGQVTLTPEMEAKLAKVLERVKKINKLEGNDWILSEEKDGLAVHTKKDKDIGMDIVRGEGTISQSAEELLKVIIYDDAGSLEIDKTKAEGGMIQNIKDKHFFFYSKTKPPGMMVSQRDVSVLATFEKDADGTIYIIGCSFPHPKIPEYKGVVRAEVHIWAWVVTPSKGDAKVCSVVYMLQNDAKGMLPKSVVNSFAKDQASSVTNLKKYVEKQKK
jgi:hypothetical protein